MPEYVPVEHDPFDQSPPVPQSDPPSGLGIAPTQPWGTGIHPVDRLLGLGGQERYQLWPERLARSTADMAVSGATLPHDVITGTEPVWDPETNHSATPAIDRTFRDLTGTMASGSRFAPTRGDLGVFLGSTGKRMLELQRGASLPEHPAAVANMGSAAIRDQGLREAQAQGVLEMRQAAGLPADPANALFKSSGMSVGKEGAVRREIPDLNARLVPVRDAEGHQIINGDSGLVFRWEHPIGDLHAAYDIPNVVVGFEKNTSFDPKTRQIYINANPYTQKGMREANGAVVHEFQHAIQNAEGHLLGSNPIASPLYREFHADPNNPTAVGHAMGMEAIASSLGLPPSPKAMEVYNRIAGEVEARNAELRRAKGFRYLRPPEKTEDIPRAQQITPYNTQSKPSQRYVESFADGGAVQGDGQLIFNPEFMRFLRDGSEQEIMQTPVDVFIQNTGRLIPVDHDPFAAVDRAVNFPNF